jgi:uncharacterized repeat protein (TIGR01451 family)
LAFAVVWLLSATAESQYVQRSIVTTNGAITFTGNSLGLDGNKDDNGQGTRGAIGTFITTDTSQQDLSPAPKSAPAFPPGTTNDWHLNRSAAQLRLPAGARVVYAELIWGGTVAGHDPLDNVEPFLDSAIQFTTPSATSAVAPDPATARSNGNVSGQGTCASCFYVRSANVTALVAAAGAGTYAVGGVPATQGTNDNQNGAAGWTLAVIYEDFSQPVRNMLLYLGLEKSGPVDQLSGFCTPTSGTVSARLAVTAMEGDAKSRGDDLMISTSNGLNKPDRLSGPRNPLDGFFSSQIANDQGDLDVTGTFGSHNHTPGTPSIGARQGWDITNVDASGHLANGQTTAFVKGQSAGDNYQITALGLQIDSNGPRFSTAAGMMTVDRATAVVGDVLTYTVVLDNSAGTADATNFVFFDTPAAGNSFVAGTFTVNGSASAADPTTGASIGAVPAGGKTTVTFKVLVGAAPPGSPTARTNRANWTFSYVNCAGQPPLPGSGASSVVVTTTVPLADLGITNTMGAATAGSTVSYQIVVSNAGPNTATGAVVTDGGTTPALTNVTWTCTVPTGAACAPASGTGPPLSTITLPAGLSATFRVTGTLPSGTPAGTISDTAMVSASAAVPDLNIANNTTTANTAIAMRADISVKQIGTVSTSPGTDVVYTITVTNRGPSDAANVLVSDPTPPGLTFVSLVGPCAVPPGCALLSGANATITATFHVPPAYAGADPIVNPVTVTSDTPDGNSANNTARATTSLGSPVADVSVAVTDNVTQVTAGTTTTYTITVTNTGPASAPGTQVVDTFDSSTFDSVQWQCVASGTSSCATPGPQTGNINTLVNVDPGAANAVVLTAQARVLPGVTGTAENTAMATVAANITDPVPEPNTDTDVDVIHATSDLSVTVSGPSTIVPGTTADFTITIANAGPSTALDVSVEHVPGESQPLAATAASLIQNVQSPPDATCQNVPVTDSSGRTGVVPDCTIPSLPVNQTRTFVVRLAIPADVLDGVASGTVVSLSSSATLSAAADDPTTGDHVAVTNATFTPQADVGISVIGPASIVAGSVASYFINVENTGPSAAANVVIGNPIPAGLTIAGGDGPCAAGFPCTLASLAPGELRTARLDLLVPIDYSGPQTYVDAATIHSDAQDPAGGNDSSSASTLVVPTQADLAIAVTGPSSVAPGGLIHYVGTVTNLGPGPALNVRTSTVLPSGASLVSGTTPTSPTTCTLPVAGASNLLFCVTPELPVGGVLPFDVTLQAEANLVPNAVITLIATATSPTPDLHSADDRVVVRTVVATPDQADLEVEMTHTPDPVVAGGNVTYTAVVRSLGPATATTVTLTDTLPPGFALVSATPTQGSCAAALCSLGSLAPFSSVTVTIIATSPSTTGEVANVATVSSDQPDPVPSNNTSSESTTVANADQANVVIEIDGPTLMQPGEASFYTIEIDNLGPAAATDVEIANFLPPGFLFYANTGDCIVAYPCEFESLEAGGTRTIVTTFTIDPAYVAPASVAITAALTMDTADPTLNTHVASLTTTVDPIGSADLVVTLADSPDPVYTDTPLSYFMTVANRGPAAATGVTLTQTLPAGVHLISARATVGTCSGTTVVTCHLGDMPAGSLVRVGVLATAPVTVPAINPMVSTASAASATPDPDPASNHATETTMVVGTTLPPEDEADLSIALQGPSGIRTGQNLAYTLTVTNKGPATATSVIVDDPAPAGLTFVSVTGACTTSFPCALGALAAGETRTIVATYALPSGYAGANPIVNIAAVSSPMLDPIAANNAATAETAVGVRVTRCGMDLAAAAGVFAPPSPGGTALPGPPAELSRFAAYEPAFTGGTSVACGDVDGDGIPEIVTGAGPGDEPLVRVWSLRGGALTKRAEFLAYDPAFRGGVSVAVGDVFGDGVGHIITGAGAGGGPHVRVWNLTGTTATEAIGFFAYDPAFPGGVYVAVGDVTGDGIAEIVTGAGPGGGPHVRVWSVTGGQLTELVGFFAYDPAFPGGVSVAVGDLTGQGVGQIITGAGPGGGPHVRVWRFADGGVTSIASFFAYDPAFPGGVAVAAGDMTGDGVDELVTAAGRNGGSDVRVWSLGGGTPSMLTELQAFDPSFTGAVAVAAGDLTGDGKGEIITAAGLGDPSNVRIWSFVGHKVAEISGYFAYAPAFPGGVSVAVGDVIGSGVPDILTGAGPGGGPHVIAWQVANGNVSERAGFFAYDPAFAGGVSVAAGDLNGDGVSEVVTGAGPGGEPRVRVWDLAGNQFTPIADFLAYDPLFRGGVSVAAGDLTGDGIGEIVTGAGPGGGPHVRIWDVSGGVATEIVGFFAFDPSFTGGVSVAVGDLTGDGVAELVTAAGAGGGSHVRIWSLLGGTPRLLKDFFAFDPSRPGAVSVAVGDVTGEGIAEIVTGAGQGDTPEVRVWSLRNGGVTQVVQFMAYDPAFPGGVTVAAGDLNGDGVAEIVTGAGPGGGPHVEVWSVTGAIAQPADRRRRRPGGD